MADLRLAGIGMTSARTRDRLVRRLREQGISNLAVLERIRNVPRHIFVDEALGSRAYEDTALPIGFGQPLLARARERLKELGIRNVRFRHGDGSLGWKAHAPFDGILVAAAPLVVPEPLLKQLKVGGRLIVPIGPEGQQQLVRFTCREPRVERESLGPVAFVPLLGGTT
jgi:protein-L-isoaspartate(D-aspartate) O-methyltransferase